MSYIGRRVGVGLGKETTRGTAVSPTYFFPLEDFDHDDKAEVIARTGRRSRIEESFNGDVVKKWSEGSLSGAVFNSGFGLVLLSAMGTDTAALTSGETAVYDHTFSVANTNEHQSLTISTDDSVETDKQYAGAVITSLEIKGAPGEYLTYNAGFMGKSEASGSITASYATENPFRPQDITFKRAATFATLSAATSIRSFTFKIEKNVEANYNLGTAVPSNFYNKQFTVTLDLEILHADDTFRDLFMAGTVNALQVICSNTAITLGVAANPTLRLDCYQGQLTDWSRTLSNNDLSVENLSWRLDYDTTNSKSIEVLLRNIISSY